MIKLSGKIVAIMLVIAMMANCMIAFAEGDSVPTFKLNRVTNGGGYITVVKEEYMAGELVTVRAVPYDGFGFYSWSSEDVLFIDNNVMSDVTTFIMPAREVTIGAIFAVKQPDSENVTVTFDTLGGSEIAAATVPAGGKVAKPETDPTKDGYTFAGWYADASCTLPFNFDEELTASTFAYAKWSAVKKSLTLTFDTLGGSAVAQATVTEGDTAAKPDVDPTKDGYTFAGWFADSSCTVEFDFTKPLAESTTVYAKWNVSEAPVVENIFTDVKKGDWFYDYVVSLADKKVISGMGGGIFAPQNNITRAQFATILANLAKAELKDGEMPFSDVEAGAWYEKAVAWAYSNKIVNGMSETMFAPDAYISRQDMALMIMRYVDNVAKAELGEASEKSNFNDDADIALYAKDAVYEMQQAGIIGGKPGNVFDPKANATRAEACKMIYVLLGLLEA